MEENKETNENVDPIRTEESNGTTEYNVYSEKIPEQKKKSGKVGILILAIILVLIVAAGIYYFLNYTKPEKIYERLIGGKIDSYVSEIDKLNFKTSKTSIKLDANLETDNQEINEDVVDLINNVDLGVDIQIDKENKKLIFELESDYDNEDLLDIQIYSDVSSEKSYANFKNILDKYIEIEDVEGYQEISDMLQQVDITTGKKISIKKATKILKEEIDKSIKSEYCSSTKETITVNGKNVNVNKNTLSINEKQLKEEIINIFTNLKDNSEFIECYENKDEMLSELENAIEEFEDMDADEDVLIQIDLYTQGLMQKVKKFAITIKDDEEVSLSATKVDDGKYDIELLAKESDIDITGSIACEEKSEDEGTIILESNIQDIGNIKLNIEYSQKLNENIDNVDVKESITTDELTSDDQQEILKNLENSKLYELIQSFSGSSTLTNSSSSSSLVSTYTGNSTQTSENEIITYDSEKTISFKIPEGYKVGYSSQYIKTYTKDDISVNFETSYYDENEYYKNLQTKAESYKTYDYKNVQLTDVKTTEVNGQKFNSAILSYEYQSGSFSAKYGTQYFWKEISDGIVLCVEIEDYENMSQEELNQILSVEITDNK